MSALSDAVLGRSHRAKGDKSKLNEVIVKSKQLLELPDDYLVGIVPATDTGATEMAMWSLLGARGVDVCDWESFGLTWVKDITKQLKLNDVTIHDINTYGGIFHLFSDLITALYQLFFSSKIKQILSGFCGGVAMQD